MSSLAMQIRNLWYLPIYGHAYKPTYFSVKNPPKH